MIDSRVSRWHIMIIVVVAAVLFLLYWPALRWMVNSWLSSDYYSHGFLVPLVSAFFIWTKREQLKKREPSIIGIWWLILAAILYVTSFVWQIRVLGALSILAVIGGLVFSIFGTRAFRTLLFPLGFLLFMVPFWFIQNLAYSLQYISVNWAAGIAKLVGLPIITTGTEIHMGDVTFTVGIVCSGINTLVALLALAAVYVYILKGSVPKRWGLFLLAIPIAIGANILRIASIIVVAYFTDVETATGWYHDISSPLFFFLAFGVLVAVGRLLRFKINYNIFDPQKPANLPRDS
jgi:exosortase